MVSNRNISTFLKEFVVKLPEGENLKFRSGGYIQIDIPKYDAIKFADMDIDERFREDWDKMKMWDLVTTNPEPTFRAYSMANHPAEGNIIMLNIRIATPPFDRAAGSHSYEGEPGYLLVPTSLAQAGDKVTISGPYGEFFLPANLPSTQELIFIGGGAGMAPMRSHIMHLFKTEKTDRPCQLWYGARAPRGGLLPRRVPPRSEGFPQLQVQPRARPSRSGGRRRRVKYTPGFVHNVLYENYPEKSSGSRGLHLPHVRTSMMIASVVKMLDSLSVPAENILTTTSVRNANPIRRRSPADPRGFVRSAPIGGCRGW